MFLWDAVVGSAAPLPGSQTSIALESRERYDSHDLSSRIIRKENGETFRICLLEMQGTGKDFYKLRQM